MVVNEMLLSGPQEKHAWDAVGEVKFPEVFSTSGAGGYETENHHAGGERIIQKVATRVGRSADSASKQGVGIAIKFCLQRFAQERCRDTELSQALVTLHTGATSLMKLTGEHKC